MEGTPTHGSRPPFPGPAVARGGRQEAVPDRLWNAPPPPARGGAPRNAAGLRCGGAARVPSRPVRAALSGLPAPARRPAGGRTPGVGAAGTEASEPRPGSWRHTWPRPPARRRGGGPWRWPGCGDPQALSSRVSGSGGPSRAAARHTQLACR